MSELTGIILANEKEAYDNLKESVENLIENIRDIDRNPDLDELETVNDILDAVDSFEEFINP